MLYKFDDIFELLQMNGLDAKTIKDKTTVANNEEGYTGYFGDDIREIYVNIIKGEKLSCNYYEISSDFGFAVSPYDRKHRYFLSDRYFLSAVDTENYFKNNDIIDVNTPDEILEKNLYKLGEFSEDETFEDTMTVTLAGRCYNEKSKSRYFEGITDEGVTLYAKFFRPMKTIENTGLGGFEIKPNITGTGEPKELNDLKELREYSQCKSIEDIIRDPRERGNGNAFVIPEDILDHIEGVRLVRLPKKFHGYQSKKGYFGDGEDVESIRTPVAQNTNDSEFPVIITIDRKEFETKRPEYNMLNGEIYRYKGDFKYYDQVLEIVKELDWNCVYSMAIVKYNNMGLKPRMYMSASELIPLLQKDGIHVLHRVVEEDIKCCSCGLFTAYNNGGCLLLEFTPETWKASSIKDGLYGHGQDGFATKASKLKRIDFKKIR